jgi:hypothetical protein
VFTPYQSSGKTRDAIIEHIQWQEPGAYGKVVSRRIAIYHLYIANRKT